MNDNDLPGLLRALKKLGGYYECPKDASGRRLGPLVGYAGRYGEKDLQYVGDVYANFARIEADPARLDIFADQLITFHVPRGILKDIPINVFCGAPEGGKTLAALLAIHMRRRYIYPEKDVTALKTATSREQSNLVWGRHEMQQGENVVIVEDVMNNFSTTSELVKLIETHGGRVVAIAGLLNRSLAVENAFAPEHHAPIPVVALVRKPISEHRQDDLAVRDDVAAGNVVWNPKAPADWQRLMDAMNAPGH